MSHQRKTSYCTIYIQSVFVLYHPYPIIYTELQYNYSDENISQVNNDNLSNV